MKSLLPHSTRVLFVSATIAALFTVGVAVSPAQAHSKSQRPVAAPTVRKAMTWVVRPQGRVGIVNVGRDDTTDPYVGDTPITAKLSMLCLYVDNSPVPETVTTDYYNGWARGWVGLTPPIAGRQLTSQATADSICASRFGAGWRMAEFHDGWYGDPPSSGGWTFWAHGALPSGIRFWVRINDQNANPWIQ